MTHDEMIAVIQAHKEGKTIESRARGIGWAKWVTLNEEPSWQFSEYDYRIKPEPWKVVKEAVLSMEYDQKLSLIQWAGIVKNGTYKVTIEEIG